jgi:hypothetical protein
VPRALERYPLGERIEGDADRWKAVDRDQRRDVIVSRVPFGADRKSERDAFVARARTLYTIASPAIVACFDAGAWDDDAFVVEDLVLEPSSSALAACDTLDPRERALAAEGAAEAVLALHAAGLSGGLADVRIDGYRQPRIAVARCVREADDAGRASDAEALKTLVRTLVPDAKRDVLVALGAPPPAVSTPLVPGASSTAKQAAMVVVFVCALVLLLVIGIALGR